MADASPVELLDEIGLREELLHPFVGLGLFRLSAATNLQFAVEVLYDLCVPKARDHLHLRAQRMSHPVMFPARN